MTQADSGKTVLLQPLQTLVLELGTQYDWQLTSDNPAVLSLIPNSAGSHVQGTFQAHQPGQANLAGIGNPKCLKSVPRCLLPSQLFQLHITVGGTVPPAPTSASAPATIGLSDNGKTIILHTGDRVTLDLGSGMNWDEPVSTDQNVLSRVVGVLVIRGAQGIYEAKSPGASTLQTNGRAVCPQGEMCPQLLLHFAVQVIVR